MQQPFIKFSIAALAAFFAPITTLLLTVLILVSFDFITGVYASIRNKEAFTSSRMRKTIEKFVFYSLSVIAAQLFTVYIFDFGLATAVAGYIAAVELISVFENVSKITKINIAEKFKDIIQSTINNLIKK